MPEHVKGQVAAYLSDALEPAEKAAFESHLAGCAECVADMEKKRALLEALDTAIASAPKLSDLELLNRARAGHERRVAAGEFDASGFRVLRWLGFGFAIALGALCLFLASSMLSPNPRGMMGAPLPPNAPHVLPDGGIFFPGAEDAGLRPRQ